MIRGSMGRGIAQSPAQARQAAEMAGYPDWEFAWT
jgi:hypothetical protein